MRKVYSEKEKKILNAAAALVSERGAAAGNLKVAEIAQAAGIGKGTVYEYFSSKDEILREAVCCHIESQVESEWKKAFAQPTFKECVYYAMARMLREANGPSVWNPSIRSILEPESVPMVAEEFRNYIEVRMWEMCRTLLERGVEEGLFPMPEKIRASQAFINLFCGLNFIALNVKQEELSDYMDQGYELLLRSLK